MNKTMQSSTRFYQIILVLLIILGSIERIYGIDRQSLWSDELFAVMASYQSFSDAWHLMINDSHPPGYVTFMYYTIPLIGNSTVAIRLHALIFGILWIPLVYLIGKRWFSRDVGLLAAAIIASSYSAIYFSQEARAYSMLIAVNLINLYCFLEILFARQCRRKFVVGFIFTSIISLYLHYAGFVFLGAQGLLYVLFWISKYRKGSWPEIAKLFGIPLLVYLPWMGLMLNHLTDTSRNWAVTTTPTKDDVYYAFLYLWGSNYLLLRAYVCGLIIAMVWTVYSHIKYGMWRRHAIMYALVFLLVLPPLAFYIESILWIPIFEKRYFLITLPLIALILAIVANRILPLLVSSQWRALSLALLIIFFTAWRIDSNIQQKLYTQDNKEHVRHAITVIKQDIDAKKTAGNYFVLMSHPWFEHYMKRFNIPVHTRLTYDLTEQYERVSNYLQAHPEMDYFYYVSLRQVPSAAAYAALTERFKILSRTEEPYLNGTIDIFKFSTREAPDLDDSTPTTTANALGRWMVQATRQKKPESYVTLLSHAQVEPQLRRHGINVDTNWAARYYTLDIEIQNVTEYLSKHPTADTLYYLTLHQPNSTAAAHMLMLHYQLLSQNTAETVIGTMDIYAFNVKKSPVNPSSFRTLMKDNPKNKAAMLVKKYIGNNGPETYAVIMTHPWFQPYLQLQAVNVDQNWEGRFHIAQTQSDRVFSYVNQHPGINRLYYLALKESHLDGTLRALQLKYKLESQDTLESPIGKLEVFRFNTTPK